MLTLIRNASVISPEALGPRDILAAGERVVAVADPDEISTTGIDIDEIDASGLFALPGIVDSHVHLLGGGGEGGPATRTPEIAIEDIVGAGVTTVIGCLGTDGITRHPSSLIAKARGLEDEGITAFIFVGSYELPVTTLTGSVRSDLALMPAILGAGEIAVSDHRSAQPRFDELARLAAECRVGGMLGGKPGILHVHLGDGDRRLDLIFRIVRETEIPITQIIPTHCNRNPELLADAFRFAAEGGRIDFTASIGEHPPATTVAQAVRMAVEAGVPLDRISVSSDANGSLPVFDASGSLAGLGVANQKPLLTQLATIVGEGTLGLPKAAALFTANPARFYGLHRKGRLVPGADADLIVLDQDLRLVHAFARGQRTVIDGAVVLRGTFSV